MSEKVDTGVLHDERGGLGTDVLALVATILMVYGAFWVVYEYFYPVEESILADVILAIRGVFIGVLGPTRGAGAFLATVLLLGLFLNVVAFTDLIGPDMMGEQYTTANEQMNENGGNEDV